MLEVYKFDALKNGKKILITGAVHGNEICGTLAINIIIQKIKSGFLKLDSGSITFIPICNVEAYKNNKREFETNLNRCIEIKDEPKLYEEKIANLLCEYITEADYYLDIHSMQNQDSDPFVFADYKEQEEFAKIFGLKYVFMGWPNVYKDSKTIKDLSTQHYGHTSNTITCTIECGENNDNKSVIVAENCIRQALNYLGIIKSDVKPLYEKQKLIDMKKLYFKENEGSFTKRFKEMDIIKKGDIIAEYKDGNNIIADDDYYMIFPNNDDVKIGDEWFYLGQEKK